MKIFKTLWDMWAEHHDVNAHFDRIANAGFDGVEIDVGLLPHDQWVHLLDNYKLEYIGQCFTTNGTSEEVETNLRRAIDYGARQVTYQSGWDSWTFDEGCRFFEAALKWEQKLNIPVAHETHRSRLLFTPWVTAEYLRQFPELKLCCDFSHWVVATESLLDRFEEEVTLAASHAVHIHARVGHEQGPQVNDPRSAEWSGHVDRFNAWWLLCLERGRANGLSSPTMTAEYGPPPYCPTEPHTKRPLSNTWESALWHLHEWKEKQL